MVEQTIKSTLEAMLFAKRRPEAENRVRTDANEKHPRR